MMSWTIEFEIPSGATHERIVEIIRWADPPPGLTSAARRAVDSVKQALLDNLLATVTGRPYSCLGANGTLQHSVHVCVTGRQNEEHRQEVDGYRDCITITVEQVPDKEPRRFVDDRDKPTARPAPAWYHPHPRAG